MASMAAAALARDFGGVATRTLSSETGRFDVEPEYDALRGVTFADKVGFFD